jgi:hypothetical protein
MHRIHRLLVIELGYEISDASANRKILCSSPPCYRRFVEEFVMGGESITFHGLVARVRTLKVEPIEGEIVDPSGRFDIQCYKRFINTYFSCE